jgi:pimeloyl-ACP methyl ester carboxylesterase
LTPAWQAFRDLWSERTAATEAPVRDFLKRDTTVFFYTAGTRDRQNINPDNWNLDQSCFDRTENAAAQLDLLYDYRSNLVQYPQWHEYFRRHQPPMLVVWGQNDPFFGPEGANAFQRDLTNIEVHLLDTGHFALDEEGETIAAHIRRFLPAHVV